MFRVHVWCVPMQLGTDFYVNLVFSQMKLLISKDELHVIFELFCNISVTLEQIYIGTSIISELYCLLILM